MAAQTQTSRVDPPAGGGWRRSARGLVGSILARKRALDEDAAVKAEEGRLKALALWRLRPGRRAVAVALSGLAAGLVLLHLLASLALSDRLETIPPAQASDLRVRGVAADILLSRGGTASVLTGNGRTATLPAPAGAPAQVALAPEGWAVTSDSNGLTTATRLGAGTARHAWLRSIAAHWRRAVWQPIAGLSSDYILPAVLQFDPLRVPRADRPRRLGLHRSCADCPEIVALSGGSDLVGPMRWQRSAGQPARRLATMAPVGMSRTEVKSGEWGACVAAGICRSAPSRDGRVLLADPSLIPAYLGWLGQKTGRFYRLPTHQEWEMAARASSDSPGAGVDYMLDPLPEWVCQPAPPAPAGGDCAHGRRGGGGKPYESLAGSEGAAALRLIETSAR